MNTEFKAGDRVKIVVGSRTGYEATVAKVHPGVNHLGLSIKFEGEDPTLAYSRHEVEKLEPEYKVGDRVKITSGSRKGQEGTVVRSRIHSIWDLFLNVSGSRYESLGYRFDEVEKVEEEPEAPKFAVGDQVVVKVTGKHKGKPATVKAFYPEARSYGLTLEFQGEFATYAYGVEEVEKIQTPTPPKFAVGDRVVIMKGYRTQRHATVVEELGSESYYDFGVLFDGQKYPIAYKTEELEHAKPEPEVEPLKVGDQVTFTREDGHPSKYNGGRAYILSIKDGLNYGYVIIFNSANREDIRGYELGANASELVKI